MRKKNETDTTPVIEEDMRKETLRLINSQPFRGANHNKRAIKRSLFALSAGLIIFWLGTGIVVPTTPETLWLTGFHSRAFDISVLGLADKVGMLGIIVGLFAALFFDRIAY